MSATVTFEVASHGTLSTQRCGARPRRNPSRAHEFVSRGIQYVEISCLLAHSDPSILTSVVANFFRNTDDVPLAPLFGDGGLFFVWKKKSKGYVEPRVFYRRGVR